MNLKKINTRIEDKGKRSTNRQSASFAKDDNMEVSAISSTVSYYLEKYPYLGCFGDFSSLSEIGDLWEDSLAKEFDNVSSDGMSYFCNPKFSKATVSQIFSALDKQYKGLIKDRCYLQNAPITFSFRFGKEGIISEGAFIKVPMSCNLDSKGFQSSFQSYFNSLPDEEKSDVKSQMEKVSSWVQPVMYAYLSETSKKEKKGLKSDVRKLNKVLTKGSDETVWLIGTVPEDSSFSPFATNEHYEIAYNTMTELQGIDGSKETDLEYVEDIADNAKNNVETYLKSIGLGEGDKSGEFLFRYCKCYSFILAQNMDVQQETEVSDSRIVDEVTLESANDTFTKVSEFIVKCGEESVGNKEVEEFKELFDDLKPFSEFSLQGLFKGAKETVQGIKQTAGNLLGNTGKIG